MTWRPRAALPAAWPASGTPLPSPPYPAAGWSRASPRCTTWPRARTSREHACDCPTDVRCRAWCRHGGGTWGRARSTGPCAIRTVNRTPTSASPCLLGPPPGDGAGGRHPRRRPGPSRPPGLGTRAHERRTVPHGVAVGDAALERRQAGQAPRRHRTSAPRPRQVVAGDGPRPPPVPRPSERDPHAPARPSPVRSSPWPPRFRGAVPGGPVPRHWTARRRPGTHRSPNGAARTANDWAPNWPTRSSGRETAAKPPQAHQRVQGAHGKRVSPVRAPFTVRTIPVTVITRRKTRCRPAADSREAGRSPCSCVSPRP